MAVKKRPSTAADTLSTSQGSSSETLVLASPVSKVQVVKPFLRGAAAAKAYYTDLSELSGGVANCRQARTVIEGSRKLCIQQLREKSIFKLHGIANYRIYVTKARAGGPIAGPNATWQAKAVPAGRKRVVCKVLKELENDILHSEN